MKFDLIKKDHKDEIYKSKIDVGNAVVLIHYHTHLKYWNVSYYIEYPPYYRSEIISGKEFTSRKDARDYALRIMNNAKDDDWKTKLSEFDKKNIRETMSKIPKFINF